MNARRRTSVLATAALSSGLALAGLQVPAEAAPSKPRVSLRATSVQEGTGRAVVARVPAVLDRKAPRRVVVRWRAVSGSATARQDFRPVRGKVVIRKGARRAMIRVRVVGDARVEGTERFRVKIVRARGATPGKRVARVRVFDNDVRTPGGTGGTGGGGGGGGGGPVDTVQPVLSLGGLLPTHLDAWTGDGLTVPLGLDEVAAGVVSGVLTGFVTTPSGDLPLPEVPFTIPAGSLAPDVPTVMALGGVPEDATALTLTVVGLSGASSGDLSHTFTLLETALLPTLTLGTLPGSLAGLLGGSLSVPLVLDEPAPVDVVGVLTASYATPGGLGGLGAPVTTLLPSVPFTIPKGSTTPVGGLALPLSAVPATLGTLTVTVTGLSGAVASGTLSRSVPLL